MMYYNAERIPIILEKLRTYWELHPQFLLRDIVEAASDDETLSAVLDELIERDKSFLP